MCENITLLFNLLKTRSFRKGYCKLSSGQHSDYYMDVRMTSMSAEGLWLIGEVLYENLKDLDFDEIGGLQVGSIPLIVATIFAFHRRGRDIDGFWVRNEVKDHGMGKKIEGPLRNNRKVVLVEDVCTTGQSTLKAVEAVREIGCSVARVVALVDRKQGAKELFWRHWVDDYRTVFTIDDFLDKSNFTVDDENN